MSSVCATTLAREITALSCASDWATAKAEWFLEYVFLLGKEDEPETCLCSHFPIKELCYLRNKLNDNEVMVGNNCVKKFMDIDSEVIFSALRRIITDLDKPVSNELAVYAREHKFLSDWEYEFCADTARKRRLTERQQLKRRGINMRLLQHMYRGSVSLDVLNKPLPVPITPRDFMPKRDREALNRFLAEQGDAP